MFKLNAVSYAVITAMSSSIVSAVAIADEDEDKGIEVIEVTATKRSQNIQSTALAVQAISAKDLKENNIGNFDDFVQFMPNVTIGGRGPGQSEVFIRGLAIQPILFTISGAQGSSPNVALYLDEQPVTAPGRNLDVYATDLQRIEVLPGPQGTLFGASSQAGTIRYITNKPDTSGFEAGFTSSLSSTAHGEMNNSVEAYINIPLTDKFAVRAAFYNVNKGGYIDNVYGTFSLDPALNPNVAQNIKDLPADTKFTTTDNAEFVEKDFNDSFYKGARLSIKYDFNDDWNLLVQHSTQELGADGVFDYDPEVGDLEVQRFFPDKLRDEFNQTSWTVNGNINELELVYTGSFLNRDIEQIIDYTGYNNTGYYIPWYTCTYASEDVAYRECLDPTKGFKGKQNQTRNTHEFRVATDDSKSLRFIGGVFYDNFELEAQDDFIYTQAPALGFAPNAPISDATQVNPNTRVPGVAFFNDLIRSEKQIALFGELSYDLTEKLTLTGGARWYQVEADLTGSSNFADKGVDLDSGRNYDSSGGHSTDPLKINDVITKFTASYKLADQILIYGTYSEGYRPVGFNRGGGIPSANPNFPDVKVSYDTDDIINYELGWKSMFFDNTLRFNANAYYIEWEDMQVSRFDPENVSILTFIENAADSENKGFEGDVTWQATDNLTLFSAFSFNNAKLTKLKAQSIELSPVGSELPLAPKFQGNIRALYQWEWNEFELNWQASAQYSAKAYNSIVQAERELQDSYTIFNASIGIAKDAWSAKIFVDNLSDERAELFYNKLDSIPRITTNRPRTIGLSVSYSFY